jgi:hypothetical protein
VERTAPHALGVFAEETRDTLPHFASGLVGERDCQNPGRINPVVLDETGNAGSQHARLPRASARENEHWPLEVEHSFALRWIEPGQWFGALGYRYVLFFWHRLKIPKARST